MLQRFHGNNCALATNDTHCGVYGDVAVRLADSFPEVAVNLDIPIASCLDDFCHFSRASQ